MGTHYCLICQPKVTAFTLTEAVGGRAELHCEQDCEVSFARQQNFKSLEKKGDLRRGTRKGKHPHRN